MAKALCVMIAITALCQPAKAASILFDFNSGPQHASLPLDLTAGGITAHFSATGQGFSIQDTVQSIGVLPAGFSGLGLAPNSVYAADLIVAFPFNTLTDFSIMFAPQDLDTDTSATLRVTASMNGVFVGTTTAVTDYQGTWPSGTLSLNSAQGFNNVVVHYDLPPPTGGDYGVIFAADNMIVTPAALPGDYSGNGAVDAADYVAWRKTDGTPEGYDTWRSHFGQTAGSGVAIPSAESLSAAVPEPATPLVLILAAACWCLRRGGPHREFHQPVNAG